MVRVVWNPFADSTFVAVKPAQRSDCPSSTSAPGFDTAAGSDARPDPPRILGRPVRPIAGARWRRQHIGQVRFPSR